MDNTSEEKINVGENILSYCGKCKNDSMHTIIAMEEKKINKLECESCGAKHNYRKPKSLTEGKTSKKEKGSTTPKKTKKVAKKKNGLLENYDANKVVDYSMKGNYTASAIIRHSSFGIGVVTKRVSGDKIEVDFEDGVSKLLVINWEQ